MVRPTLGYLLKMVAIVLLVLALLGGLYWMRLREADALLRIEGTMGLYRDWHDRVADLERQFPFEEKNRYSWGQQQLATFLAIKNELAPYVAEIRKAFPSVFEEQTHDCLEPQDGLIMRIIALRSHLLSSLKNHDMNVSQYRYFEDLVLACKKGVPSSGPLSELTPAQKQTLGEFVPLLQALETHGIELFGLPMP